MSVDQYISSGVLELYAAHALPPEEMKEVEEMVAKNPRVRAELDAITENLKRYAELYAPQKSEELYDKIIARIHDTPAEEPKPEVRTVPLAEVKKEKLFESEPLPKETNHTRTSGNGRYLFMIAASILLLIASIGVNVYLFNKYSDTQTELTALQNEKNTLVSNDNVLKTKYDETENKLKIFTDPQNKMVIMKGMPISPASEVMVMWTGTKDVYIDVHRLPAAPEGMQYQLWAISTEGKPVDAGMLTPYKEQKVHGLQPMKKIPDAVAFAITLEKRGGSPTPTMDQMYVQGKV